MVNPFTAKSHLQILLCLTPDDFTLSNVKRFYSSKGDPLVVKGLRMEKINTDYKQRTWKIYAKLHSLAQTISLVPLRPFMVNVACKQDRVFR